MMFFPQLKKGLAGLLLTSFCFSQAWANDDATPAKSTVTAKANEVVPTRYLDADKLLPWPGELNKDVQFWINVYTKVDTGSGYLHDAKDLGVVYGKIKFDKDISRKKRNKLVNKHRKRVEGLLDRLVSVEAKDLNAEESRIYKLFPAGTDAKGFKEAKERIRFQLGQSDKFQAGITRSGRWMPHFTAMMKKHKVPDVLRLLPHVESSFTPYARSHVGAAGMWQFTRGTGRRFMKVNHVLDERLDPYIAAEAAAKLLRYNFDKVDAWPLAITAYNHGLRSVSRAADKFGKNNLVKILREYDGPRFGFASRNFYVSFVAAVHVHTNYKRYFGELVIDEYRHPDILRLPNYLSVKALEKTDLDKERLQQLNPALSNAIWRGDKHIPKHYALRLPEGAVKTVVGIDRNFWFTQQIPDLYHRIRRGESLSQIAQRYKIRVSALKKANNIRNANRIRVGQRLVLPGRLKRQTPVASSVVTREAKEGKYKVQRGDTLGEIAEDLKISVSNLKSWNNISNVRQLSVGQSLYTTPDHLLKPEKAVASNLAATVAKPDEVVADAVPVVAVADDSVKSVAAEKAADNLPAVESTVAVNTSVELESNSDKEPVESVTPNETGNTPIYGSNDFSIDAKNAITVLPVETIGHYADWLKVRSNDLRQLNKISRKKPIVTGNKLRLNFDKVTQAEFTEKRQAFHNDIQQAFYKKYKVMGQTEYKVKRGDSLWLLAQRDYGVPIWLLKQYNPGLAIEKIYPGAKVIFPLVVRRKNNT